MYEFKWSVSFDWYSSRQVLIHCTLIHLKGDILLASLHIVVTTVQAPLNSYLKLIFQNHLQGVWYPLVRRKPAGTFFLTRFSISLVFFVPNRCMSSSMSLNLYFDFDLLGGWQGTLVWVRIMPLLGCITSLISMQKVVRMSLKCFLKFLQPWNFFITGAYILLKFLYLRSTNNFAHMNMNVSFVVGGYFYFSTFSTFPSD